LNRRKTLEKTYATVPVAEERGGPGSAGQSGDTQGLPDVAEAAAESVRELVEEGQYSEAEFVLGVEAADEAGDVSEVKTHEVAPEKAHGTLSGPKLRRRKQA
jgi:glutamate synthase domain-containing protein 1